VHWGHSFTKILIFFLKFSRQRFQRVAEVEIVANKLDLKEWVVEAIKAHGGVAHAIDSAKFIWVNYHDELQGAGDLFYTWQQEVQSAIVDLRREGRVLPKSKGQKVR
jgi:hypothetical protein